MRQSLIDAKQYTDVEQLTIRAIVTRDSDSQIVEALQRARVRAFMAEGNFPQALKEAKSYYNVVSLSGTGDAISLLTQILRKTDPSAAARLQSEQMAGSEASAGSTTQSVGVLAVNSDSPPSQADTQASVLASIQVDADVYAKPIAALLAKQNAKGQHSYNRIARGNLLLLADRPDEALAAFLAACPMARGEKNIGDAVEGVARAMRAQSGTVAAANVFILSLQQDPSVQDESLISHAKGSPKLTDFQAAAQKTLLADLQITDIPPLEQERLGTEQAMNNSGSPVQITSGFEGSSPIQSQSLSPTHFSVAITTAEGSRNWFMFHLKGVAGKTIRLDILDPSDAPKWWSLNPMYSYSQRLDDLNDYLPTDVQADAIHTVALNGSLLPPTRGQSWHYIEDAWQGEKDGLSLVQHFDADEAYVAMRVPYTPAYNDAYLDSLKTNPFATVYEIGTSPQGRRLRAVEITEGGNAMTKPCVLIYAREHANEQDTSWVVQGAIQFLLSSSPEAVRIRRKYTLLAIPILDPDGAAAGLYHRITDSFSSTFPSPESTAIAVWLKQRMDHGQQLEVVINLHNIQSAEAPHAFCPFMSVQFREGYALNELHLQIINALKSAGYLAIVPPQRYGTASGRLSEWAGQFYGSLPLAYEVNSQESHRHLSLDELRKMGQIMVAASTDFLESSDGLAFSREALQTHSRRLERVRRYGDPAKDGYSPFLAEIRYNLGISPSERVDSVELMR